MNNFSNGLKRIMKTNGLSVFLFEILYKLFMVTTLVTLVRHAVSRALRLAGFSYLTTDNALRFLCTPGCILVLIVIVAVFMLLCSLEFCCLITAYQAGAGKVKMSTVKILIFGARNFLFLFGKKKKRVHLLLSNLYLLTGSWILVRLIRHTRPLSYIVAELSGIGWVKAICAVLMLLMLILWLLHIFIPSIVILRQTSYQNAASESRKLFGKHRMEILLGLVCVNLAAYAFYQALQLLLKIVVTALVFVFADAETGLALALTLSSSLDIVSLILTHVFVMTMNTAILVCFQYRYQDQKYMLEIPEHHYQLPKRVRQWSTWAVLGGGTIWLVAACYFGFVDGNLRRMADSGAIKITAHRGLSSEAPENTLPAVNAAVDCMADFVEIDVQETKDGVLVVFHDALLKRIVGANGRIRDYTYVQLLGMDFGGWFGSEFERTRIPTLREVLEVCRGNCRVNIEIKAPASNERITEKVVNQVVAAGMQSQIVISSTTYSFLRKVKELNPDIETGYILSAAYGDYFNDDNLDFFSVRASFVTPTMVRSAHEHGKQIHAWTVNTKAELSRLKRLQVDNIITDKPVLAREMLYRERDTEGIWEYLNLALGNE